MMYEVSNLAIAQEIRHLNLPTPSPMRGVGVLAGGWALETAMDELAHELGMAPVELRIRNDAKKGPMSGHPFSSKHLDRCFARGRELIGWEHRPPAAGRAAGRPLAHRAGRRREHAARRCSTPRQHERRCAPTARPRCAARRMRSATAPTPSSARLPRTRLALPVDAVSFDLGDSTFPEAPITAGSRTTASVGAAVLDAGRKLLTALKDASRHANDGPLSGIAADDILAADGRLSLKGDSGVGEDYAAVLRRAGKESLSAEGSFTPAAKRKFPVSALSRQYEMHSFGAIFAEVRVDVETGVIRVPRLVGVYDVGRVINPRPTASQLRGAMITGLGGALTEEGYFDPRNGRAVIPRNLADYHIRAVPTRPTSPVETLDIPDPEMGDLGARGLGELGTNNRAGRDWQRFIQRDRAAAAQPAAHSRPRPGGPIMTPFQYKHAPDATGAIALAALHDNAQFIAGGTSQVDLMKEGVQVPGTLIDISRIGLDTIEPTAAGGLRIGANVRNSVASDHAAIRRRLPRHRRGAARPVRPSRSATWRPWRATCCSGPAVPTCGTWRSAATSAAPGTGCAAVAGFNRMHAIFGQTDEGADNPRTCIAVHPVRPGGRTCGA